MKQTDPIYQKYMTSMMALCSRSEKCKWDIRENLRRKAVKTPVVEEIIQTLETEGFLNEKRYARAYVKDKIRLQGWGPMKIQAGLQAKNIPEAIAVEALKSADSQEYVENLQKALENKQQLLKEQNPLKRKEKLVRFALGRGYTYQQIYHVLNAL